jgi:hypothetical protein
MTNFLRWRRMTWALVLWSAAMCAWPLIGSVEARRVAVLWFAGAIAFGLLWLATQPLFRQGHGLQGLFVRPGPGHWRVANFHRTYWTTDDPRDPMKGGAP